MRPKYSRQIPVNNLLADLPVRRQYASSSGPSPVTLTASAGLNPQRAQWSGATVATASAAESLPPLVQRRGL